MATDGANCIIDGQRLEGATVDVGYGNKTGIRRLNERVQLGRSESVSKDTLRPPWGCHVHWKGKGEKGEEGEGGEGGEGGEECGEGEGRGETADLSQWSGLTDI